MEETNSYVLNKVERFKHIYTLLYSLPFQQPWFFSFVILIIIFVILYFYKKTIKNKKCNDILTSVHIETQKDIPEAESLDGEENISTPEQINTPEQNTLNTENRTYNYSSDEYSDQERVNRNYRENRSRMFPICTTPEEEREAEQTRAEALREFRECRHFLDNSDDNDDSLNNSSINNTHYNNFSQERLMYDALDESVYDTEYGLAPYNDDGNIGLSEERILQFDHFEVDETSLDLTCDLPEHPEQEIGMQMFRLDCQHLMCRPCVDGWLRKNSRCPICRHDFNSTVV